MSNYRSDQIKRGKIHGWYVYVLYEEGTGFAKIGSAARTDYRLGSLQSGNPRRLQVLKAWHLDDRETARMVEMTALKNAGEFRIPKSEWLKPGADAVALVEAAIISASAVLRTSTKPRWDRA